MIQTSGPLRIAFSSRNALRPLFALSVAAALIVGGTGQLAAQDEEPGYPRITVAGVFGVSFQGLRYERSTTPTPNSAEPLQGRVQPTDGAVLGLEAGYRLRPNWTVIGGFTASPLGYHLEIGPESELLRSNGGDQLFFRGNLGTQYRVRPEASGYFSGGLMATWVDPTSSDAFAPNEESRVEVGGYLGLGLDFFRGSSRFLRTEFRAIGSRTGADAIQRVGAGGGRYEAESFVFDFSLTLQLVFGFR